MTTKIFARQIFAGTMILMFGLSAIVRARPMPQSVFVQQDGTRKLPPVNWIRSRGIDIKHITVDLHFDWEKEQAIGSATITLAPFSDRDRIELDAASMTINSVTGANGSNLEFTYDGKNDDNNLEIKLDRVYTGGEDATVKVDYKTNYVNTADAETPIGGFGRGLRFIKPSADEPNKPRQIWSQGETEFNRYWFPSYDSPNDFRTTEFRVTVDKPFFVVSNGKLIETKDNGDNTRTFDWKMDQPYSNYLSSIVVVETTPVVQDFEGIPVYNYGYTNETKEVAATVKNLPATMKFFSETTGVKYPYAKYSQAFVEDFGGGMENISATTMIEEMIHDERELLDTDSESLQSHELAHQWFGDYVTCRDWGQIWLNESFATYMQAMWDEKLKGHDEFLYDDVFQNQYQTLQTWNQGNRRPIVTKHYANKDAMFDTYAYPGGASILHMLRKHLGDKLFSASLKNYLTTNAHQPVSTEDLRIAVEETSGQSMDWFFDQWLYRMGHPVFEITQNYDETKKQLTLNVKQTQKIDLNNEFPQTEFFRARVDVEIDGKIWTVGLAAKVENVFVFDSPAKPKLVNFDYEGTLLKEMTFEKTVDDLIYQLQNDKDVLGRRWALTELRKKAAIAGDKERIADAVRRQLSTDKVWQIRNSALAALKEINAPKPPDGNVDAPVKFDAPTIKAIQTAMKDEKAYIRAAAFALLGTSLDPAYADLYISGLNDRSYSVIDSAGVALAGTKDKRAYAALVKLTNTPSWKGRIQIAGYNGLAELGDPRAFEVGYKAATDKNLSNDLRTIALAIVGSSGKGDQRAFPLILDKFKKSLEANDLNGLQNTVNALIKIADPRGQEAFDMLRAKFKDQPNIMFFVNQLDAQFKAAIKP